MRTGLVLGIAAAALAACTAGSSEEPAESQEQVAREYQVGAFDRIALGGSHDVIVKVGGAPSVRAEGPADVIERLEIKVENGELSIGTKKDKAWSIGFKGDRKPVTVHVTVPSLAGASIGGSGDVKIDRVQGEKFTAAVAGSGDLGVETLEVRELTASIAGSGNINARGTADNATLSIAGSGDIDLSNVQAKTATASVVGSGDIRAQASETADVSIMGSGDVEIAGGARCRINKAGSGDVRCG